MDHLPAAGQRGRTCGERRGTGVSAGRPPLQLIQPWQATRPRRAHRHEARGGGDEHADDHPLAAPGRTVWPLGLWAGADAVAKLG